MYTWCNYVGSNDALKGKHVYFNREDGKVDLWVRRVKHVVELSDIETLKEQKVQILHRHTGAVLLEVPEGTKDFRGKNLQGADLRHFDLAGASFRYALLIGVNLSQVNLREADFTGANLNEANFRGAYLNDAKFEGANIGGAMFDYAKNLPFILGPQRSDGYLFICDNEKGYPRIKAGCRTMTFDQARERYNGYPQAKREETLAIIDCLEAMAKARGWVKTEALV